MMIYFVIIYLSGYFISFKIGIYLTKQFVSNNNPFFDKADSDNKIAIRNMSIFIILISSWIVVLLLVFYLIFIWLKYFFNKRLT